MPELVLPLTVRDLTAADLRSVDWGSTTHRASVATAVERARRGDVDYLAVCPPSNVPVATGGVDYARPSGVATLWQLSVGEPLRSCGIGTILIQSLEQRIQDRGLHWAELGVDEHEPRPRALYERLGYVAVGRAPDSWDVESPDGSITRYDTMLTVMRKPLG